jgi:hypothetical protein
MLYGSSNSLSVPVDLRRASEIVPHLEDHLALHVGKDRASQFMASGQSIELRWSEQGGSPVSGDVSEKAVAETYGPRTNLSFQVKIGDDVVRLPAPRNTGLPKEVQAFYYHREVEGHRGGFAAEGTPLKDLPVLNRTALARVRETFAPAANLGAADTVGIENCVGKFEGLDMQGKPRFLGVVYTEGKGFESFSGSDPKALTADRKVYESVGAAYSEFNRDCPGAVSYTPLVVSARSHNPTQDIGASR